MLPTEFQNNIFSKLYSHFSFAGFYPGNGGGRGVPGGDQLQVRLRRHPDDGGPLVDLEPLPRRQDPQEPLQQVHQEGHPPRHQVRHRNLATLGYSNKLKAWLPDGYSQIFRSYVFGPSGLWLRYATLQNLIPSFPFIAPHAHHPGAIQGRKASNFAA